MRTHCCVLACGLLLVPLLNAADESDGPAMTVRLRVEDRAAMESIQALGIDVEHYQGKVGGEIELVIGRRERLQLDRWGIGYRVVIADMDAWYAARTPASHADLAEGRAMLRAEGVEGFRYGSMGGFYTYDEVSRQLDTMILLHGSITSAKLNLGTSREGRTVWGLEISDNPGVPEPGEATVYFDALHHAREPMSMAVAMYYMWWLLDHYGTDPEATYLVNNRRILFVPVVNPDGYVYNQGTNPNGGGNWRKNRSTNSDGSRGVDLNRNYGYQWGYDNLGSSGTPSSETYRGAAAFSEPETRAVRDFTLAQLPSIALSLHSVAGRYLNPYGYKDTVVAYEQYALFAGDFSRANGYLYGTVYQMLDYNSNGTTRDWLHHDLQCTAWTPEVGGSGFWPAQPEIIPLAQENLAACKYITWVAGGFADYQSFRIVGRRFVLAADTLRLSVTVRNKGLRLAANSVDVTVQPLQAGVTTLSGAVTYPAIAQGASADNDSLPFAFVMPPVLPLMTEVRFACTVRQEGVPTSVDTFAVTSGYHRELFTESAEGGTARWVRGGNGVQWDTAFTLAYRGDHSLADSRYGNVANSTSNSLTTASAIDLAGASNPRLEFFARWSNERSYDYVRVQVSTNNGSSWTTLSGRYTTTVAGQPGYTGNGGAWAGEQMSLTPYIGRPVKLRFTMTTDVGIRGDGFYVDDLRVVDYRDTVLVSVPGEQGIPAAGLLEQNFPNPFNPVTTIRYSLPARAQVRLTIVNGVGQEIRTLTDEAQEAGVRLVVWDGNNAAGVPVGSGVYFCRLKAGGVVHHRKMVLLR